MPVPQNRIGSSAPIAAETLALTKGEIIENARGELVVEVELREAPVQFLTAGQRPVHCAGQSSESVGKPGIESAGIGIAQESVQAVVGALLSLNLKRIVAGPANVIVVGNCSELAVRCSESFPAGATAKSVTGDDATRGRRSHVLVQSVHQDVGAAGAGVADGQHDLTG